MKRFLMDRQTAVHQAEPPSTDSPSIVSISSDYGSPSFRASLASKTENRGAPVRKAVHILENGFPSEYGCTATTESLANLSSKTSSLSRDSTPARVAWHLVSIWILAKNRAAHHESVGLREATAWFFGDLRRAPAVFTTCLSKTPIDRVNKILNEICFDDEFQKLLPYILEEHGPGSRASVLKDPLTAEARSTKRASGVFYTPADVADYIVTKTRSDYVGDLASAKTLDPACGTGVFLLAMLRTATAEPKSCLSKFDYIINHLYGMDISPHALDSAGFLLTRECLSEINEMGMVPYEAWRAIRNNVVEADALRISAAAVEDGPAGLDLFSTPSLLLSDLFPRAPEGFEFIVGNPPYASLPKGFQALCGSQFASLRGSNPGSRVNIFTLFIEMMWKFSRFDASVSALVTPLSIAYHRGIQYESCRQEMSRRGGRWQFAFFDREPHGLFGEEVKTRNAIIFRTVVPNGSRRLCTARVETGRLRKWTSRKRSTLFQDINYTPLGRFDITNGIPKLDGVAMARAFLTLSRREDRFVEFPISVGTCKLVNVLTDHLDNTVFVGGTAYNFLNVYHSIRLNPFEDASRLSNSSVHYFRFGQCRESDAAFAVLCSRLVFWLWHVLGDGFHVPGWFFERIPFARTSLSHQDIDALSEIGAHMWIQIQKSRFVSVNGGKLTIGFRPLSCQIERDAIDCILARAVGLDSRFTSDLKRFVEETTIVDTSADVSRRIQP